MYELTRKERNAYRKGLRDMYAQKLKEERRSTGSGPILWIIAIALCLLGIGLAVLVGIITNVSGE